MSQNQAPMFVDNRTQGALAGNNNFYARPGDYHAMITGHKFTIRPRPASFTMTLAAAGKGVK